MQARFTPKAAATLLGISVSSLRNYCSPAMFAEFLSPEASPAAGRERRLSAQDVAVLQRVVELRAQAMTTDSIKDALQSMDTTTLQTPYIDIQPATIAPTNAPQTPTEATTGADVLLALQSIVEGRYNDLQTQMEAMRADQKDRLTWFLFGIIAGVLIVGVVAAIVLAGASLR